MKKGDYKKTTNSKEQWIKRDLVAKGWIGLKERGKKNEYYGKITKRA